MESRLDSRKKQFKKRGEDPRRRREEHQVSLRKNARDEELRRKRFGADNNSDMPTAVSSQLDGKASSVGGGASSGFGLNLNSGDYTEDDLLHRLPALRMQLYSDDLDAQFSAAQLFRRLLSIEMSPPIQPVLDAQVLPRLIEFLKCDDRPRLQFEAAWSLTNIASGTQAQTKQIVEGGAVPMFVSLLSAPDQEVREQAVWALGNISGDCPEFREIVLAAQTLPPLLRLFTTTDKPSLIRNATWTLSNLCRGKPAPDLNVIRAVLPTLVELVHYPDMEVLADAGWALSYLSDGSNEHIDLVIDSGVCNRLIVLLSYPQQVSGPALRTIGNIVTGNDRQTQHVLDLGVLPELLNALRSPRRISRKEACWTISNVTAGSRKQIQAVYDADIIPVVLNLLQGGDHETMREAAWAICNAASGGTTAQIEFLVKCECIPPLCRIITLNDTRMTVIALEALENILRAGVMIRQQKGLRENPYCSLIEEADGVSTIEKLQDVASTEVSDKAYNIITAFFPFEEESYQNENEDYNIDTFAFDTAPPTGGFTFADASHS